MIAKIRHRVIKSTNEPPTTIRPPVPRSQVGPQEHVNHPAHYGGADNPYEVVKVLRAWGLNSNAFLWNAVKYIARAGKKDPSKLIEDLEKARWYLDGEIKFLKSREK